MSTYQAAEFVQSATLTDTPEEVTEQVRTRVLDTLAAITAGYRQEGVDIAREYATTHCNGQSSLPRASLLDGSNTTIAAEGAALANGVAANALDIDDGHREVKGHPAAVVVPPALAAAEAVDASIGEFLDAVFIGYELAVRTGLAIHATDDVYTGTGSWGALGAAAAVSRLLDLKQEQTAHALSVAEYHAPRTPIMRGVENPAMTKDGVGWSAHTGYVAAQLAAAGFTGSKTIFDVSDALETLGDRFHVTRGYLKPYPCCRWAQPGVEAVLTLTDEQSIPPEHVETIRVSTFEEATHLRTRTPASPEEAQYSYPYPVAAALVRGQFTQTEHTTAVRTDPEVLALTERVDLVVDDDIDARFPSECLARVDIETPSKTYSSPVTRARGSRESPLSKTAQLQKARRLVVPTLSSTVVSDSVEQLTDPSVPVSRLTTLW
ncbi:MmgE/PrpD family protein [Natronorubrum aibiense]|uniref:MmgE/PrpD family protein n=1 Tax=Natronorubrum aibiense TaxID=348826 RepID=A0A5P9P393_9EURY|nr:MmgE/PrpD family protein [Natronorubrum aibiense]QFU82320.1 MmgE/PrpD family protein [Natronorubrum aibiense]